MLQANKAIRDNEVVDIYEMTVEDFKKVKRALEKLHFLYNDPLVTSEPLNNLVNYFHFQGEMKEA